MMSKGKKLGLAAILVGLCTAGAISVASAHGDEDGPGGRRAEILQKFDANHDGKLDDSEKAAMREAMKAKFEARKQEMLQRFDTNKDGKLDDAERAAMKDAMAAERFAKLDTDGNGSISLAEFKAGMAKMGGMHGRRGHHGGFRHHGDRSGGGHSGDRDGGDNGGGAF
jgi:EF hand